MGVIHGHTKMLPLKLFLYLISKDYFLLNNYLSLSHEYYSSSLRGQISWECVQTPMSVSGHVASEVQGGNGQQHEYRGPWA